MNERYLRQSVLPEVGAAGQARLLSARVLVIGAGGLGCAVLQYLAGAGVGNLTLIDPDGVELCNLHRQPLYRTEQLGQPKAQAARTALLALNPELRIQAVQARLDAANAPAWVAAADLIIDAADSFAVTYILSDTCRAQGKPLVSASVIGVQGYVGVFCGSAPSYRAVFPDMPPAAGSCAQSGVLGSAVGVLGTLQAHLALAMLLQWEPTVSGRMITVDLRTLHFGGFSFAAAAEPASGELSFIAVGDVTIADTVIDLRSAAEAPQAAFPHARRCSVESVAADVVPQSSGPRLVLCCRSGLRAWRAARVLQSHGHTNLALLALGE